jgi:hypothetical protein
VISLAPQFITPQDRSEKQDSEVAAAKRWISNYASEFKNQPVTLLGDDLYSRVGDQRVTKSTFLSAPPQTGLTPF